MFFFCIYLIVIVVAYWSAASGSRWWASMWRDWPNKRMKMAKGSTKGTQHQQTALMRQQMLQTDARRQIHIHCRMWQERATTITFANEIVKAAAGACKRRFWLIWSAEAVANNGCLRAAHGACLRACSTQTRREPSTITATNEPCKARLAIQQQLQESIHIYCCCCLSCSHY